MSLAMKLLNFSRGALASAARADKSLVSRWLRGMVVPRDHNLAVLTEIVRTRVPGFTQLSWDLPLAEFAHVLGGDLVAEEKRPAPAAASPMPAGAPRAADAAGSLQRSRAQSAVEVAREGQAYTGVYASFRTAFRNTGELIPDLLIIWREGERLYFRVFDPSFTHTGDVLILRHQLFLVGEDDQRVDGLYYVILNGVSGQKAYRTDGILMTVTNDRQRTPGAAAVVYQRIADLPDESAQPAKELLVSISNRMRAALFANQLATIAGPEIMAAIHPVIGAPGPGGGMERLLRRPMESSLAASEMEMCARLIDDLGRVRSAFLDAPTAAALGLDLVIPPSHAPEEAERHGASILGRRPAAFRPSKASNDA